jgi:hypothetical protein
MNFIPNESLSKTGFIDTKQIRVFKFVRKTNDIGFICRLSNSECVTNLVIFQDRTLCNKLFFSVPY